MGIDWSKIRNVMDMKAINGGFAAALLQQKVWVMNVIPVNAPDTLPIIFERGPHASTLKDWQLSEDACNKHSIDGDGIPGCLSKTSHAPQRITLAKPGRVVGPLPPYENGNLINQAYDPRTLVKNAENRSARMKSETLVRLEFT